MTQSGTAAASHNATLTLDEWSRMVSSLIKTVYEMELCNTDD